ncbi:MAG: GH116 family glycosyl hydrolase, partial [Eubacteriales bacterium]
AWYFPNLVSASGREVGHVYENYFTDSVGVTDFMRENREYILTSVRSFSDNLYNTGYPESFADSVSEQLANLVKSAWWVKDGSFGIWEGLGSCGFHTTDITYHGSFGLITLFPELQKAQMEMGAKFQREDGRVHHFFTPDFTSVDGGFDRVDMNPQFVLLVCRDYFATGDREYLSRMWSHVVSAMDSIEQLDSNGDALPDKNASRNTYDAWHFCGTSTYISVLWLASLKAASAMAEIMGEADRKAHWDALVEKGRAAVEEKLFNGRYYDLWVDGDKVDRCCMTDQLDGEYFSRLIGLGGILDDEHVKTALDSIYEINYSTENGLVNAMYPDGETATVYTYRNCQGLANWSGIEYMMASFYLLLGDYEKGYNVMNTVQERYRRAGEIFNHAECGDHYYRPLSSWALMQSLGGMSVNIAQNKVVLREKPLRDNCNEPWFTSAGYGQVKYNNGIWIITCAYGSLKADEVCIGEHPTDEKFFLKAGDSVIIKAEQY